MSTAFNTITKQLNEVFAELDTKLIEQSVEWVMKRYDAVREYQKTDEYKDRLISYDDRRAKLIALAGGKTYLNMFDWGREETKKRFIKKTEAIIEARNANIANKLIKAEITQVLSSDFTRTSDGFNGIFKVETNKGPKVVTVDTIYAGGYNIQCFHIRVLVKVK